jgi:RimJ/RimL family protein N-acetyltransferase
VVLGPLADRDYELLSKWASSASWVYARGSRVYVTADDFRELIESSEDSFLMVRTASDGEPIGAVSWRVGQYRTSYEVGVMIGEGSRWQGGFGAEAVLTLFRILFSTEKADRVQFICGVFNKPVIQLCCSGFIKVEGILRDYYFFDGTYHDAVLCSILRDEFFSAAMRVESVPREEIEESFRILRDYLVRHPIRLRRAAGNHAALSAAAASSRPGLPFRAGRLQPS